MPEFKAGDIVKLKSGGPLMTVINVTGDEDEAGEALCYWFSSLKAKEASHGFFPPEALTKVPEVQRG